MAVAVGLTGVVAVGLTEVVGVPVGVSEPAGWLVPPLRILRGRS